IARQIARRERRARLGDLSDLQLADLHAAARSVETLREPRARRESQRLWSLVVDEPDARESGFEIRREPARDLRDHVARAERARHAERDEIDLPQPLQNFASSLSRYPHARQRTLIIGPRTAMLTRFATLAGR